MKDPLQREQTKYEVLDVSLGANNSDIKTAFSKKLVGGKPREITSAMKTLLNPVERTHIDVFLFCEPYLNQLTPGLTSDLSRLVTERKQLAEEWSRFQQKHFPFFAAVHSLAVLWYWWARYSEEEQWSIVSDVSFDRINDLSEAPPLGNMWISAISHWVYLANSSEFWSEWMDSTAGSHIVDIEKSKSKIIEHFVSLFNRLSERYKNSGADDQTNRLLQYDELFSSELRVAERVSKNGFIFTNDNKQTALCFGPQMAKEAGLIELLSSLLPPELQSYFSPHSNIAGLIENRKFEEAIVALNSLSPTEKKSKEVQTLIAKANLERGKELYSLDDYAKAFEYYARAWKTGELREGVREAVITSCKKAEALANSNPDLAINLLNKGLKITDEESIKIRLSEHLINRAIGRINTIQKAAEKGGWTETAKGKLGKGLKDLERATELDPSNKRASETLVQAKRIYDEESEKLLEYLKHEEWDLAQPFLESKLKIDPADEDLRKTHSTCCANWAVSDFQKNNDVNNAVAIIKKGLNYDPGNVQLIELKGQIESAGKTSPSTEFNKKAVELAEKAQREMRSYGDNKEAKKLLREAYKCIFKAEKAAPFDSTIMQNKSQIKSLASQINVHLRPPIDWHGVLGALIIVCAILLGLASLFATIFLSGLLRWIGLGIVVFTILFFIGFFARRISINLRGARYSIMQWAKAFGSYIVCLLPGSLTIGAVYFLGLLRWISISFLSVYFVTFLLKSSGRMKLLSVLFSLLILTLMYSLPLAGIAFLSGTLRFVSVAIFVILSGITIAYLKKKMFI